jgi:hypothetical protein
MHAINWCFVTALFQGRRREQGPLRHWWTLREVTVRCYLTSKASRCPMKLSRFINHEFFQSYKADNKQQATSSRLVKSEDELWTDLVRAQAGWITAQFLPEFCKVMVHNDDEPIGARQGRIWGEDIWVSRSVFACNVLFLLSVRGSSNKVSKLRQSNMLNLITHQIGKDALLGIKWTN